MLKSKRVFRKLQLGTLTLIVLSAGVQISEAVAGNKHTSIWLKVFVIVVLPLEYNLYIGEVLLNVNSFRADIQTLAEENRQPESRLALRSKGWKGFLLRCNLVTRHLRVELFDHLIYALGEPLYVLLLLVRLLRSRIHILN